jgi:hypothetical protein
VSANIALEIAERIALTKPKVAGAARYRLRTCRAGCSPSAIELTWEDEGNSHFGWLDAEQRCTVTKLLDCERGS